MNKIQKGCLIAFLAVLSVVLLLIALPFIYKGVKSIYFHNYKESLILGKTSAEVEEIYGEFDQKDGIIGEDGLVRCGNGGYIVRERYHSGIIFVNQILFYVTFDANGIAVETGECLGPWGG